MQAMILAAGMGKRLKELTQDNTKCMVRVNGVTLIERALRQLDELKLSRIVLVIGYQGEKLVDYVAQLGIRTPIDYVNNPIYYKTNNIYSLALAKNYLVQEDTLLLESDLIFEPSVLRLLMEDTRESLALVDKYESWMDGTCIKVGEEDNIEAFIPGKKFIFGDSDDYYKTVNIYKFGRDFSANYYVPFLEAYEKALGDNEYYEQVLRVITMLDDPQIQAKKLSGQLWYEIDDIQDLDIASSMFANSEEEKVELIQGRYGGYWRYPAMLDFCYLVNPYFPPKKLVEEMKNSFETLLTQYPSGMRVNALLAAKNFGVSQNHIVVGNGAAELIRSFMGMMKGSIGMIRPTFEEYPNRYESSQIVVYEPQNKEFSYTAKDLMEFFSQKEIQNLILINPDNPSGNYMKKEELLKIAAWAKEREIRLVVDESFADFAEEENNSLIAEDILQTYPELVVVKSISKSYGVPGLRLGVLASADEAVITSLKRDVAIWNINSFAEYYLQIAEKYQSSYQKAIRKFQAERKRFVEKLCQIPYLRVIPSEANYVMAEVNPDYLTAKELTKKLLCRHNIFIKDLSGKISPERGAYIRLAVRNKEEDDRLLEALLDVIK